MPKSPKPAPPVAAKRARKKSIESDSMPFLRFHHSHELRVKTLEVLKTVENAEKPTAHSGRLTDLILELTDNGMDQHFLQSLKKTKATFVVQQSATPGLSGVQKVMGTVVRNMVGRMDDRQLLSVCGSIRQFMPRGSRPHLRAGMPHARVLPDPSLKWSANGGPPGPGRRYAIHFRQPAPGVLPSSPAWLER